MTNKRTQNKNGLVGKYFYGIDTDVAQIKEYGRVMAQVNDNVFLVQVLITSGIDESSQRLILVSDMLPWEFSDYPLTVKTPENGVTA